MQIQEANTKRKYQRVQNIQKISESYNVLWKRNPGHSSSSSSYDGIACTKTSVVPRLTSIRILTDAIPPQRTQTIQDGVRLPLWTSRRPTARGSQTTPANTSNNAPATTPQHVLSQGSPPSFYHSPSPSTSCVSKEHCQQAPRATSYPSCQASNALESPPFSCQPSPVAAGACTDK
ncbi:hypothetical protein SCHPADRAFT_158882 [Schizopora paradoxa]|uniref:Uncharacterized protein n=1 Tax=Schizopora paradoxa TaxID=27342 RepID=A0A0H2SKE9_9AGAM|nr:hypothetical protein SCHPADRAFT_158882 [Schizopora paradoxa]